MVAANPNNRFSTAGFKRINNYFDHHPEVSKREFLREAVEREIQFRERMMTENVIGHTQRECEGANAWLSISERELRIHAWLIDRLMLLQEEKRGIWYKLRRFLFDNRLGRWLGLQPWWTR